MPGSSRSSKGKLQASPQAERRSVRPPDVQVLRRAKRGRHLRLETGKAGEQGNTNHGALSNDDSGHMSAAKLRGDMLEQGEFVLLKPVRIIRRVQFDLPGSVVLAVSLLTGLDRTYSSPLRIS